MFLERGPLYLVAVSRAGEPEAALLLQLDLLHAHLLAILTDSFERTLARNPRFEPRRLLGAPLDTVCILLGIADPERSAFMRLLLLCSLMPAIRRCPSRQAKS